MNERRQEIRVGIFTTTRTVKDIIDTGDRLVGSCSIDGVTWKVFRAYGWSFWKGFATCNG